MPTIQSDRLNVVATKEQIKSYREQIEALPIECADNNVFDADDRSEKRMNDAIASWSTFQLTTIAWRLTDNSTIDLTLSELTAYRDEVILLRAVRALTVYPAYLAFVADPATTVRDLEDWKDSYTT